MSTLPIKSYLIPESCVSLPIRSPFSKAGFRDAGFYFFYVTNRRQWSVMLESKEPSKTIDAADFMVPSGYAQLWVFEKIIAQSAADERVHSLKIR